MRNINIGHKIFIDPSMTYMYMMGHIKTGHKIFVDPSMTYMYKMRHMNIEHKIFVDPSTGCPKKNATSRFYEVFA